MAKKKIRTVRKSGSTSVNSADAEPRDVREVLVFDASTGETTLTPVRFNTVTREGKRHTGPRAGEEKEDE